MSAKDYLELPDCTYVTVPVPLDVTGASRYRQMKETCILEYPDAVAEASSAAVLSNKLLQICNGAIYSTQREVMEVHDCKIEALLELLEALNGKPVLVFYNFQHDRSRILRALNGKPYRVRELVTTDDERAWNAREVDVLLAHPASSAYGLNLQDGGNHCIWYGMNWSLELYQQANKRLHRQGQTQKVFIYHLVVPGGLDEDVALALERKDATQGALLAALRAQIKTVTGVG
jgi:SNF2 family DNA or RNA helicase